MSVYSAHRADGRHGVEVEGSDCVPAGVAGAARDGGTPGQTAQRPVRDGAAAEVQRGEGGQVAGHRRHHRVLHKQTCYIDSNKAEAGPGLLYRMYFPAVQIYGRL